MKVSHDPKEVLRYATLASIFVIFLSKTSPYIAPAFTLDVPSLMQGLLSFGVFTWLAVLILVVFRNFLKL